MMNIAVYDEKSIARDEMCDEAEKTRDTYLFWNVFKNETTDPKDVDDPNNLSVYPRTSTE